MRRFLTAALTFSFGLVVLGLAVAQQPKDKPAPPKEAPIVKPREGKSETIKLFDGKTLDGFEGNTDLWSVEDGEIVGKNKDEVKVSTYLLTKKMYSDFRLTFKTKLVKSEMHSGIAFWGHVAPEKGDKYTFAGHLVMFPKGYGLYDLYGREGKLGVNGAPAMKVGHDHEWNDIEILAQGNRIRVAVNGTEVMDWRDPEPDTCKEGPIGLQLHANKEAQEVRFKDLTLTTFPAEDKLTTVKDKDKPKDK